MTRALQADRAPQPGPHALAFTRDGGETGVRETQDEGRSSQNLVPGQRMRATSDLRQPAVPGGEGRARLSRDAVSPRQGLLAMGQVPGGARGQVPGGARGQVPAFLVPDLTRLSPPPTFRPDSRQSRSHA